MQRVAAGLSWSKSQPARVTSGTTASPQSADTMLRDAAFQASQEYADAASWLAKTTVSIEDYSAHLGRLPLSRIYDVVDECRRRAVAWSAIADCLEARARGRSSV